MKKLISISFLAYMMVMTVGCDDVFEEDITNDIVTILSPQNGTVVTGNSVQFRWDSVDGADDYRIQVVEEITQSSSLDSLVTGNDFTFSLTPGEYSWRIKAENFAYQTSYNFPVSFTMVSSDDLAIQTVFLNSPSQDLYTNRDVVILTWDNIQAAETYNLEVDKTIQGNTVTDFQIGDLTSNNYTLNSSVLAEDAIYTWKIKAVNENSETAFSSRRILLDSQTPNQPLLSSPDIDETISDTVDFLWSIGTDSGEVKSPVSSVIEIAVDINFVNIIQTETVNVTSRQIVFSSTGEYYWRVRAIDQAGNESVSSEIRKFTVQ